MVFIRSHRRNDNDCPTPYERPAAGNKPPADGEVFWLPAKCYEINSKIPDQSTA